MSRTYVIVLCGAADRPIARLGGQTPLEFADCPHLDALAERGASGRVTMLGAGLTPGCDSALLALLGHQPLCHYTGRGPLEALGAGVWRPGAIAFRVSFAAISPAGRLDRRPAVADAEAQRLAAALRAGIRLDVEFTLVLTGGHHGVVTFSGGALSATVRNTDPGVRRAGAFGVPEPHAGTIPRACIPLDGSPAAAATASAVNAFTGQAGAILAAAGAGRPAVNAVLFRDGGDELPRLRPDGRRVAVYSELAAHRGLCALTGARFAGPAADPRALADEDADVVVAHLPDPARPSRDDLPHAKVAALERLDRHFIGPLTRALGPRDTIIVTADHCLPCEAGHRTPGPVPAVVAGPDITADGATALTEYEAAYGELTLAHATQLLSAPYSTPLAA
jgi:2,3-bisphosphoglycerate-independent phosphoglycerate mutase